MVEFICPNCGNNQLCDQSGNPVSSIKALDVHGKYACSECGAELSKEQMGALITASVQETSASLQICTQARNAKNRGDYETAGAYYQQLQQINPNSWEADFYTVYCNCYNAVGAVENACQALQGCLDSAFNKIDMLQGVEKQNAVKFLVSDAGMFALHMFDSAVQQHAALDVSSMTKNSTALKNKLINALNVMISCADKVMGRYGNDPQIAPLVELPATVAIRMQSRQSYVTITIEPETHRTLLDWIGRYNPQFVEDYKKKQNKSMTSGNIFLMVVGVIFLALGLLLNGTFAKWFCLPMAGVCLLWGIFRIIIQVTNKKLNG